eukprot:gene8820-769_t
MFNVFPSSKTIDQHLIGGLTMQTSVLFFIFTFFLTSYSLECRASRDAIQSLEPKQLWSFFYDISCIPRCPKNEAKVRNYIVEKYAKTFNFETKIDKAGNLLVKVPATKGFEKKPAIIVQSHLDMVCEKNEGTNHDFTKDPIQLIRDNTKKWIKGNHTTLGADDGMGVVNSLLLGIDRNLKHSPLELLFTVEEELGLQGALNLSPDLLTGKYLINIDSSLDEGITVGSAGGVKIDSTFKPSFELPPSSHQRYTFKLFNLLGGHSGMDINKQRANSIKIITRILNTITKIDKDFIRLIELNSGTVHNSIAREGSMDFSMDPKNENSVYSMIKESMKKIQLEFKGSDPNIDFSIQKSLKSRSYKVVKKKDEMKIRNVLQVYPTGVISMDPDLPNTVQTSANLAFIKVENDNFVIGSNIRSSVQSALNNTLATKISLMDMLGAHYKIFSRYPGWKPDLKSNLLKISKEKFKQVFDEKPTLTALHAGLEPGVIESKYPGLEMISIGPLERNAHTPEEKVLISSVPLTYQFLFKVIEELSSNI